ncbi:MAG: hypothetical protein QNJ98_01035 [Planctomycetota bacterium]|nr:hypothetical protein [Planctomycetota bacterium]
MTKTGLGVALAALVAGVLIGRYALPQRAESEPEAKTRGGDSVRFEGMGLVVQDPNVDEVAYRTFSANAAEPSPWRCVAVLQGRAVDRPPNMTEYRDVYRVEVRVKRSGTWSETTDCTGPCAPGPCVITACGTVTANGTIVGFNCEGRGCPNPFANTRRMGTCQPGP